jgi:DNA-binding transcriptional ArsR family regulator
MERFRGTVVETSQENTLSLEKTASDVLKALGDPVRWSIIAQIAAVDELPCADLEQTLPVSKPTISYHTKILQQAGLISVRKEGRNYFYALRRDVLRELQDELWRLAPGPRPVGEAGVETPVARPSVVRPPVVRPPVVRHSQERPAAPARPARRDRRGRRAAGDDEVVLLTW